MNVKIGRVQVGSDEYVGTYMIGTARALTEQFIELLRKWKDGAEIDWLIKTPFGSVLTRFKKDGIIVENRTIGMTESISTSHPTTALRLIFEAHERPIMPFGTLELDGNVFVYPNIPANAVDFSCTEDALGLLLTKRDLYAGWSFLLSENFRCHIDVLAGAVRVKVYDRISNKVITQKRFDSAQDAALFLEEFVGGQKCDRHSE